MTYRSLLVLLDRDPLCGIAELAGLAHDTLLQNAEQAAQRFRDECRAADLESFDAAVEESDVATALVRAADLGGATRGLLASMTAPVLMSH